MSSLTGYLINIPAATLYPPLHGSAKHCGLTLCDPVSFPHVHVWLKAAACCDHIQGQKRMRRSEGELIHVQRA